MVCYKGKNRGFLGKLKLPGEVLFLSWVLAVIYSFIVVSVCVM